MATWSILIATLARREEKLRLLLGDLREQVRDAAGAVEIVAYRNHGEKLLGEIRQALVMDARGKYISFIDDDDRVPEYYVEEVLPLLDGVDYIGWRMQAYRDGCPLKPTFHSLEYSHWFESDQAYYRDVSHLNPVRVDLARRADFANANPPEDVSWSDQMRPHLHTEHCITEELVMYHYLSTNDSTWRPGHEPAWNGSDDRLELSADPRTWDVPHFRWHSDST